MGYRRIFYRDHKSEWSAVAIVHCSNSVSNNDLLDWYSKEYLIERSRLVVSCADAGIIECPLGKEV